MVHTNCSIMNVNYKENIDIVVQLTVSPKMSNKFYSYRFYRTEVNLIKRYQQIVEICPIFKRNFTAEFSNTHTASFYRKTFPHFQFWKSHEENFIAVIPPAIFSYYLSVICCKTHCLASMGVKMLIKWIYRNEIWCWRHILSCHDVKFN